MDAIDWEYLEKFVNSEHLDVEDAGPLYHPISSVSIVRDEEKQLILTTTSLEDSSSNRNEYPAGTVRMNNDSVVIRGGILGGSVLAIGVQPFSRDVSRDRSGRVSVEISTVHSVEVNFPDMDEAATLIEWIENVDDGYYSIWPDLLKVEIEEIVKKSVGPKERQLTLQSGSKSTSIGSACTYLKIGDHNVYFCKDHKDEEGGDARGFIIYSDIIPDEDVRKKIRNCISFAIGRPLVYLGYSLFTNNWKLVGFKAVSAYTMSGAAFNVATMPPSPLSLSIVGEIDANVFSHMVSALYSNYELCGFSELSWAYWHAVIATSHIAAVHFGAIIESLQKSYVEAKGKVFKTQLIDTAAWKKFRIGALELIDSLDIPETERSIMKNKVNNMNESPRGVLVERFFSSLEISFGSLERAAWQRRNDAAHGNEIDGEQVVSIIRDIKILRVLLHRTIMAVTGGAEFYYDYFSIGHPIREVKDSIPEEVENPVRIE